MRARSPDRIQTTAGAISHRDTGLPVWLVEVVDFDPQARTKTYRVKVVSELRPVPPDALAEAPIRPVVLQGLMVTPYIAEGNRPSSATPSSRSRWTSTPT
jgi:hypothetical protein